MLDHVTQTALLFNSNSTSLIGWNLKAKCKCKCTDQAKLQLLKFLENKEDLHQNYPDLFESFYFKDFIKLEIFPTN